MRATRLAFLALASLAALPAAADTSAQGPAWEGTAGVGPLFVPAYSGGRSRRTVAVPLVDASYGDWFRMELFRGTAYVAGSEDRKMGLGIALEPRFGFKASDGARLSGMATRKDTLEGGLSFEWEAPWADLSVSWLGDATRAARGTSLNAELEKELLDGTVWSLTALAGVDRISGRTANYYLGVRPEEATALRTAYQPGSSTHLLGGMKGRLRLEPGHAITFGTYVTRLGTREAASPIVETRQARLFWLGYAWDL